jgi:hypothetical protein
VEPAKEPIQEVAKPVAEPLVETIAKPVAEPTMEAISEPLSAPITEQTAQPEPESVAASVEQPDEPPLTEPVVEPQPSAVNTRYQSNVDEGLVNPDSEITTRLSAAEESTKAQASSEKTLQKVFLVAISVAAVLALVVGISSFRKSQVEKEEALSTTESIVTPEPTVVTEQTVAVEPAASTGATNTDPNSTQPPVQGGVTGPQDTAAAGAVASPAVIATVAGTLPTPLPTVVPTANPTATPPPEPTPALGAAHKATLVVTESVAIKISLDGKISFSGTREAGSYPIEFQKSADIYVEDGSKVSLKYPGWDNHGPLGMVARKRRVILSSDPYPGFGRGSL